MVLRNSYWLLVIGCWLLVSCSIDKEKEKNNLVFRYNEHSNISSLDPAFAKNQANIWVVNQLFTGLVQLNDSLLVKPDIAKGWTISKDGKTYTFLLRNDVKFHKHQLFGTDSTRAVKASDFEYSFNRLLDANLAAPGGWVLQNVADFKAKNDSVFVINLKQPFPPFLGLLSMKYCSVVPKEIVEYYGSEFRSNPIGTGPFKFKLWVENTKLVLRKNENYYEKQNGIQLPFLEAVAITFLPDKQSEFLQFVQGNLDLLNSIDPSYKDDILTTKGTLQPRYADKVKMQSGAYLNTEYLGILMDGDATLVHSKLIRQAVNYGFDRVKMIQYLRNGIGTPAINGFIPKGLPSFNNLKGYTYQPEKAKNLIKTYKLETGNTQPAITISTNSQYVDLCEYMQRELQNIGLEVIIDVIPPSTLKQSKASGKLSIFRASWIADYPDAENYLSLFYSRNFAPNGPNYMHFSNPQFDAWYEESITTTVDEKRYMLYQKMDSLVMAEAPVIPLYYDEAIRFTQKNITGLGINPINLLSLKRVRKE
ncbi:ABC transporter substrate-binding protein [Lutibacter sp. B1]|uniref:ABC transporter substrate-binding protein n=1 Tax=Lutibacter sp. B1 TaxID=2725996 RepID=UPI001456DFA4|nr:ABC transporter substrate-binding protein [Lutibacter sp. B1]NLP58413.1 ABC transporter substrate-binding protein [Lutibacter sp. B1]